MLIAETWPLRHLIPWDRAWDISKYGDALPLSPKACVPEYIVDWLVALLCQSAPQKSWLVHL